MVTHRAPAVHATTALRAAWHRAHHEIRERHADGTGAAAFNDQGQQPARRRASGAVERLGDLVRPSGAGWSAIVWSDLDEATADAAIARRWRTSARSGRSWSGSSTAATGRLTLGARLEAAGFVPRRGDRDGG